MAKTDELIEKAVNQIIKELESANWSRADRLQKVLEELTKIKLAEIDGGKIAPTQS